MPPLNKLEVDKIIEDNLTEDFHLLAETPGFVLQQMPLSSVILQHCDA